MCPIIVRLIKDLPKKEKEIEEAKRKYGAEVLATDWKKDFIPAYLKCC
jgi:hypothetical protein